MSGVRFLEPLIEQQIDGTAVTNGVSTRQTGLIAPAAKFTIPANFFVIGRELSIRAAGRISTASSTPGTLTLDVGFGSIVVFSGGASGTLVTSASNLTWLLEITLTCRSIGASTTATMIGTGKFSSFVLSATLPIQMLPASSPAAGTGFDSTVAFQLELGVTYSSTTATNTMRCDQFNVWSPN